MRRARFLSGMFSFLFALISLYFSSMAMAQIVMPIDNLPGYSFYPCDSGTSGTCSRQPGDARTWYSVVYRGPYAGNWQNRGIGSGSHPGVDIAVPSGTPIKAIHNGTVVDRYPPLGVPLCPVGYIGDNCGWGWGNHVVIRHEGLRNPNEPFFSAYCHLSSVEDSIQNGSAVTTGALIGHSGNSGSSDGEHLHFQIDREKRVDNGNIVSHPYWPVNTDNRGIDAPDKNPPVIEYSTYNPIGFIIDHQACGTSKPSWEFKGPNPRTTIPSDRKMLDGYTEGWTTHNVDEYSISNEDAGRNGVFYINPSGSDPWIQNDNISFLAISYNTLKISLASNAPDGTVFLYFQTNASPGWGDEKSFKITINNDGQFRAYTIPETGKLNDNPYWTGTITGLRIDPAVNGTSGTNADTIGFEYIHLISRADLNQDGYVNSVDFGIMMSYWGSTSIAPADINQDGLVNSVDFGIMMSNWYNP